MTRSRNSRLFMDALKVIPGGVNSPVRAFKAVGGSPIFIERAKGPYLYDADGRRYIDYCLSWGPMILGHAHKQVVDAAKRAMARGTSYGIPTAGETELAQMIVDAIDSVEKVRLMNSGTEAVMTAIRLARGATGMDKIIKFIGCYHGHADHLLVKAGSGAMTMGVPSSPGVPKDFTRHTIPLPYNNVEAVEKAFDRYSGKIAAVIVEPVAGNMGVIAGERRFLARLRKLCTRHRSVLIFDEVISGFRLGYGGVQKTLGVEADLTCLGKVIGGGFPIGACAGRAAIMDCLSPVGRVYQAGTLAGNPVCTAAGIETLKILKALKPYTALERATKELCEGIAETLEGKGIEYTINRVGSMFTVFFARGAVTDYVGALKADTNRYAQCFRGLLAAGIYLPPSQFEACFLSTEHKERDIAATLAALRRLDF